MKTITPYLLKFAITATILTLLFRHFLSFGIDEHSNLIITISAILYGILMFISGWFFGKKDGEYLPIFDVGFRFHLTTYIIHNSISLAWVWLGLGSKYEKLNISLLVAMYWGSVLLMHFIFYLWTRKNTINNLSKDDIFD